MDSPIVISLVASGIGMLMLFLALAFLYGLIYLMTVLTKDRPEVETEEQGRKGGTEEQRAMRRQAAVIGVALARAERDLATAGASGTEEPANAWRALHHQRQLMLNLRTRRTR
jgi:Na+-transporting methylmalonyl-CoA/oxaloacetate decarboxylase gamma subunit